MSKSVDNLDKLSPSKFEPSLKPSDMTEVVTVTYLAAGGKKIGWVDGFDAVYALLKCRLRPRPAKKP